MTSGWAKLALSLLGGLALLAGGAWGGYTFRDATATAELASLQAKASTVALLDVQARTQATMASAIKAFAEKQRVQTVTRTIVEKVPVYVTAKADAGCTVTRGFVRVFNAGAGGYSLPDTASGDNDAASPALLSSVARTTAENFGVCHENAAELTAAQEWIKAQLALNPR